MLVQCVLIELHVKSENDNAQLYVDARHLVYALLALCGALVALADLKCS